MSRSIKNGPQLNPGTYTYDATSPHSSYRLSWNNWDTFRSWKNTEEEKGFNFTLAKREKRSSEKGWLWKKFVYAYMEKKRVPSNSSSEETYVSDNQPDEKEIVNTQKAQGHQILGKNCSCVVMVKAYTDTNEIWGHYNKIHTHSIGKNEDTVYMHVEKNRKEKRQKRPTESVTKGVPNCVDGSGCGDGDEGKETFH